jgi:hypothetical protein
MLFKNDKQNQKKLHKMAQTQLPQANFILKILS